MFGRNLNRDLLKLAILTLITVLTWAGFDIYQALHQVEIPQVLKRQILPLDPQLDQKVLSSLKEREFITKEEAKGIISSPLVHKVISQEATESATVSASLP